MQDLTADEIITILQLAPHPEGGHYRQSWESPPAPGAERSSGTCIYFLLKRDERSHWHRVDADEIWLWHAGAPLVLSIAATDVGPRRDLRLGPDLVSGDRPQQVVSRGQWQAARSTGEWTLVSCTVTPGFRFDGFELADPGFNIS